MKSARIRELKAFGILFCTFFFGSMFAVLMSLYVLRPLLQWLWYGSFKFIDLTNVDVTGIVGILAAFSCFAAVLLVLEGKHSGRW